MTFSRPRGARMLEKAGGGEEHRDPTRPSEMTLGRNSTEYILFHRTHTRQTLALLRPTLETPRACQPLNSHRVSCHGDVADIYPARASRSVVWAEEEPVSTRSRVCIDLKQSLYRLEADCGSTQSVTARRLSQHDITAFRRQGNYRRVA